MAVLGDPEDPALGDWWWTALMGTSPGLVVAAGGSGSDDVPLLRDRPAIDGRPTAYVCEGFTCDRPTTDLAALADRIGARRTSMPE